MMVGEYGKYILILGYRLREAIDPKVFIEAARNTARPVLVQFFDAEAVAGEKHLFFATLNAMKSFSQARNIAQTLDVEIILYASAQRQIGEAIRIVGLNSWTSVIIAVLVGDDEEAVTSAARRLEALISGDRDRSVLERIGDEKLTTLMETYGIDTTEIEALSGMEKEESLQWLIVERGALLDARR